MRRVAGLTALLALALAAPVLGAPPAPADPAWADAAGFGTAGDDASRPGTPEMGSAFAYPSLMVDGELLAARGKRQTMKDSRRRPAEAKAAADSAAPADTAAEEESRPARRGGRLPTALSGERARLMLQSLTLPGWGQATIGRRREAFVFALLEAGVWGSFTAFRIQEHLRRETYLNTARLFGGIDLNGRDEEYRRLVGQYLSSEEYNRLVVRRDAANLYYGDPAAYDAYIAEHEVRGSDAWAWESVESLLRYRTERAKTQRATKHAHDALAAAIINRLVSVIHVSRSQTPHGPDQTSWKLECVPAPDDPSAFRFALRADF
jgi:hypothetical protein